MAHSGLRRPLALLLGVATITLGSLLLSACAPRSGAYAASACTLVRKSITIYERSLQESPPTATKDRVRAQNLLRSALPLAALAASTDGTYEPLQTTLSESNRVTEGTLVHALRAECTPTSTNININLPQS